MKPQAPVFQTTQVAAFWTPHVPVVCAKPETERATKNEKQRTIWAFPDLGSTRTGLRTPNLLILDLVVTQIRHYANRGIVGKRTAFWRHYAWGSSRRLFRNTRAESADFAVHNIDDAT